MRVNARRALAAFVGAAALSACSGGGPSEDDTKTAMLAKVRHNFGADAAFESFELEACNGEKDLYRCKLRGVLTYTFTVGTVSDEKRQPLVGHYTFMRTDDGWQFVN